MVHLAVLRRARGRRRKCRLGCPPWSGLIALCRPLSRGRFGSDAHFAGNGCCAVGTSLSSREGRCRSGRHCLRTDFTRWRLNVCRSRILLVLEGPTAASGRQGQQRHGNGRAHQFESRSHRHHPSSNCPTSLRQSEHHVLHAVRDGSSKRHWKQRDREVDGKWAHAAEPAHQPLGQDRADQNHVRTPTTSFTPSASPPAASRRSSVRPKARS